MALEKSGEKSYVARNSVGYDNNHPVQTPTPPPHPNDLNMARPIGRVPFNAYPPAQQLQDQDDDDDHEGEESDSAAIRLTVHAHIEVKGDNNIVASDQSVTAQKVSLAVVTALKAMSMGAGGIPMIDENGRPREINITVHAETKVNGSKNVIGEHATLETLRHRDRIGRIGTPETQTEDREIGGRAPTFKRERDDDVRVFAEFKKQRKD